MNKIEAHPITLDEFIEKMQEIRNRVGGNVEMGSLTEIEFGECCHINNDGICELTHMICRPRPSDCMYNKIFEKGRDCGYSEGRMGDDW